MHALKLRPEFRSSALSGMRAVIDTNVLVAGLRSQRGASFALLSRLGGPDFLPELLSQL